MSPRKPPRKKNRRSLAGAKKGFDFAEAVPGGWYPVECNESEARDSSSGNPMLTVVGQISDGDYTGKYLRDYLMLDPDIPGSDRAAAAIEVFGYDPSDFDENEIAEALVGLTFYVKVTRKRRKPADIEAYPDGGEYENRVVQYSLTDPNA